MGRFLNAISFGIQVLSDNIDAKTQWKGANTLEL